MLKVRIIPTLLWKNFGLVKGTGFDSWRRVGSVLPAIKVYNQREVDELIILDILAHENIEELDYDSINDFSQECFIPLTIGGGIREINHVEKLLRSGSDKVSVNTAAYDHPELITNIANKYGSQCIVASIDVNKDYSKKKWKCFSHAGKINTEKDVIEWSRELEGRGAGEILITSIERDGTMKGYDLELIEAVASSVNIPVIASGGAGNYQHMVEAVLQAGASAVAAASMFHFTEQTPAGAKKFLSENGIPVRKPFMSSSN